MHDVQVKGEKHASEKQCHELLTPAENSRRTSVLTVHSAAFGGFGAWGRSDFSFFAISSIRYEHT